MLSVDIVVNIFMPGSPIVLCPICAKYHTCTLSSTLFSLSPMYTYAKCHFKISFLCRNYISLQVLCYGLKYRGRNDT